MAPSSWGRRSPAFYRSICEIVQGGRRAGDLIRQLLAFSRRQVIAPAAVDVNQVLAGLERTLRRLIGEDIQLHSVLAAGSAAPSRPIPASWSRCSSTFVVNARDALPSLVNVRSTS